MNQVYVIETVTDIDIEAIDDSDHISWQTLTVAADQSVGMFLAQAFTKSLERLDWKPSADARIVYAIFHNEGVTCAVRISKADVWTNKDVFKIINSTLNEGDKNE